MARQPDYCLVPVVALACVQRNARTDIVKQVTIALQFFILRTLTSVTEFCFKPKYFHVSAVARDASAQLIKMFICSCTPFNIILEQPPLRLVQVTYDVE